MSDLIIAQTTEYSKRRTISAQLQVAIDQTVMDANTVLIKEKVVPMTVQRPTNVPRKLQNKRLENLTPIKDGVANIDEHNRLVAEYEDITQNKNMTYFPDMAIICGNNEGKVIGGTINNDI